jgi:malic enzyme
MCVRSEDYYNVVEEFMNAVKLRWPSCLVQFEDFSNANASNLLEKYRDRHLCFNDDIQVTYDTHTHTTRHDAALLKLTDEHCWGYIV